jgi:hypothetical protein
VGKLDGKVAVITGSRDKGYDPDDPKVIAAIDRVLAELP